MQLHWRKLNIQCTQKTKGQSTETNDTHCRSNIRIAQAKRHAENVENLTTRNQNHHAMMCGSVKAQNGKTVHDVSPEQIDQLKSEVEKYWYTKVNVAYKNPFSCGVGGDFTV